MRCQRPITRDGTESPCDCFEVVGVAVINEASVFDVPVCGSCALAYLDEGRKIRWLAAYETRRRD